MKLTYDPRYNVAYFRLHEKTAQVETLHLSDELNVDIAADGTLNDGQPIDPPWSLQ